MQRHAAHTSFHLEPYETHALEKHLLQQQRVGGTRSVRLMHAAYACGTCIRQLTSAYVSLRVGGTRSIRSINTFCSGIYTVSYVI